MYAFFIQWSPEIYAEDTGEYTREPGFIVVKKMEESETNEDSTNETAAREWEVRRKLKISFIFLLFVNLQLYGSIGKYK